MPGTPPNANSLPPPGGVRSTPFLRLWAGSTASGLATWALPFVLGLAVLEGALTAIQLGLVLAARTTGFLAAMPVSGVLADRFARRGVVLYASLLAAMGIPVLLLMLGSTSSSAPALMMLGAAIAGMGQGACRPAYQALVPLVVGRDGLQAANAAMSISVRVTALVGPSLATALAVTVGARATLAVIIVMWLPARSCRPALRSCHAPMQPG